MPYFSTIRMLSRVPSLRKAERLDREDLKALQERRFRALLRHTLTHSPFYIEHYRHHGLDPLKPEKLSLGELPTVDKNLMMENFDRFTTDRTLNRKELERFIGETTSPESKFRGQYTVIHTSGSSGTIGIFVYGPGDWAMAKAMALSRVSKVKPSLFKKTRYGFIGATEGHFAGVSMSQEARSVMQYLPLSINDPLDTICGRIQKFQPEFIMGYASAVNLLAQLQREGAISISPKRVVCSGDSLTEGMRQNIRGALGVEPINFYGASEGISIGIECNKKHRMHIFDDWFILEVLDENFQPVKEGEPGQVYLTNLYNYTQPLIRYRIKDEIVVSEKRCECGRPFRVIDRIAGRQEDFLWFTRKDGRQEFIHPIVLAEFFVPGLVTFQFRQPSNEKLVVRAVVREGEETVAPAIVKRVKEILAHKQLAEMVSVEVEIVERIDVDRMTGKFRLIVPKAR
ncbi:MAG: hypothetical protein AB1690_02680 [Candidatus Zixiibacteriota bacterium]